MPETFHLGHFLKESHVEKAIVLLSYQFSQSSPLYNNLDFTLYRLEDITNINPTSFYNDYIARDSLYYFENLFYSKSYFSVQRAYKVREFHYLSLPALIIYYAIGLYIRELMNDKINQDQQMYSVKPMHIYYGGWLNHEVPSSSKIFYYDDFKDFLTQKEELTRPETGKKIFAISLDIKSFFYTVNHSILFNIIERKAGSLAIKMQNYDEDTKRSISVLFELLQAGSLGLPVSSQNLISSFLSSIYLSVLDDYILGNYINHGDYQYLRYVDDFYLIFKADASTDNSILREQIYDIENDISHFLMHELELSVSTEKSKRFEIIDKESQIEFLKSSSLDSPFDQDFDYEAAYSESILSIDTRGKSTPDIFNRCIDILAVLKARSIRLEQLSLDIKDSAFLNYILILKSCLHYSRSQAATNYMDSLQIFENITAIDYILIKPKVFLHLITVNKRNRNILVDFLVSSLSNRQSILPKLTLLDKFIHQMHFLISEARGTDKTDLQQEFQMHKQTLIPLLQTLKTQLPPIEYLDLLEYALLMNPPQVHFKAFYTPNFLNDPISISLMQQIKLRRISELNRNFSVSLNHLINEFQNLFGLIYFNAENRNAQEITSKMNQENYHPDQIALITDFFRRRNENSVSHPNAPEIGLWALHANEYDNFKRPVHDILEIIYNTKPSGSTYTP